MQHKCGRANVCLFNNQFLFPKKSQTWKADFPFFFCITNVNNQIPNSCGSLNRTLNLLLEDNFKWRFSALSNYKPLEFVGNPLIKNHMKFHICWGRLPGLFCLSKWNVSLSCYCLQQSDSLKRNRSNLRCGTRGPICVVHNDLSPEPFHSVETQVINPG